MGCLNKRKPQSIVCLLNQRTMNPTKHTQREDCHWLRVPRGPSYNRCFIYLAMSCDLGYVVHVMWCMCVYISLKVYYKCIQMSAIVCMCILFYIEFFNVTISLPVTNLIPEQSLLLRLLLIYWNVFTPFPCLLVICFELICCFVFTFVHACIPWIFEKIIVFYKSDFTFSCSLCLNIKLYQCMMSIRFDMKNDLILSKVKQTLRCFHCRPLHKAIAHIIKTITSNMYFCYTFMSSTYVQRQCFPWILYHLYPSHDWKVL